MKRHSTTRPLPFSVWHLAAILACVGLLAGCHDGDGLERVPITGTLTIQGKPLPGASIQFLPLEGSNLPGALGVSDETGRFEVISSREEDTGVPPGEYSVRVSRFVDEEGTPLLPGTPPAMSLGSRESIPSPYDSPTSPLKVVIPAEGGKVDVDIPEPLNEFKEPRP
jgi:hypothetical protein